jgi:hypothetical protein
MILAAIIEPMRVGDHELAMTTSIGIVERPVADTARCTCGAGRATTTKPGSVD